jgi:hypothetical protein
MSRLAETLVDDEWARPLTNQERAAIKREIAARAKNVVYMQATQLAEALLDQLGIKTGHPMPCGPKDLIRLTYCVEFVGMDLAEIVGGLRRGRKGQHGR